MSALQSPLTTLIHELAERVLEDFIDHRRQARSVAVTIGLFLSEPHKIWPTYVTQPVFRGDTLDSTVPSTSFHVVAGASSDAAISHDSGGSGAPRTRTQGLASCDRVQLGTATTQCTLHIPRGVVTDNAVRPKTTRPGGLGALIRPADDTSAAAAHSPKPPPVTKANIGPAIELPDPAVHYQHGTTGSTARTVPIPLVLDSVTALRLDPSPSAWSETDQVALLDHFEQHLTSVVMESYRATRQRALEKANIRWNGVEIDDLPVPTMTGGGTDVGSLEAAELYRSTELVAVCKLNLSAHNFQSGTCLSGQPHTHVYTYQHHACRLP